jgi:hypothetical protein
MRFFRFSRRIKFLRALLSSVLLRVKTQVCEANRHPLKTKLLKALFPKLIVI